MSIFQVQEVTDEVMEAIVKLIPQLGSGIVTPSLNDMVGIVNSDNTILLAASEDGIVGFLTMVINIIPSGKKLWVEDVVVDVAMRGKGIGKQLIECAIKYARDNGFDKVDLTSSPERVAANRLYQSIGFVKRQTNMYRINL